MKDVSHPLLSVLNALNNLKEYGNNAVLRRAITSVLEEINNTEGVAGLLCIPDRNCRPDSCARSETLEFTDLVEEVKADEKRATLFLNPKEAMISHLTSFFSGNTDALEIRMHAGEEQFLKLEEEAIEYIKQNKLAPLVNVNYALASSKEELLLSLKQVIYEIENQENITDSLRTTLAREECRNEGVESLGGRFISNGRAYQQGVRDVIKCYRIDRCCGNRTYTRSQFGPPRWATVWSDGNTSTPPPVLPPLFEPRPWNNELSLFPTPVQGRLESDFGWRNLEGNRDFHGGIDIAVAEGTQVLSINNGRIVHINTTAGHGSNVIISDGTRTYTYLHINPSTSLQHDQAITSGTVLGTVAGGGRIHLHYAVHQPPSADWQQRSDDNSVDPLP